MKSKILRSKSRGETIVEAVAAMIIFMLGMAALQTGLAISTKMMRKADKMRSDTEAFTKELRNGSVPRENDGTYTIEFVLRDDNSKKMFATLVLPTADSSTGYHIKYCQANGTTERGDITECRLATYKKTVTVNIDAENETFGFYTYGDIANTAEP